MFYALPNLSSHSVSPVVPWEYEPKVPPALLQNKTAYVDWKLKPSTQHCLISCCEGVLPTLRVSEANPPHLLHGFIVDYDNHNISRQQLEVLRTKPTTEWQPAWACRTFSGGARLVWLFESPIRVPRDPLLREFLRYVYRKMKLSYFLPGFDEAFYKMNQYYDVGTQWIPIEPEFRIPKSSMCHWLYEAGGKIDWADRMYRMPLSEVASEVAKRFPGRWPGDFLLDSIGPRFWDPSADNPRGCIVRESGMQCFTGDEWFMPWSAIFGAEFVERFRENQVGIITAETFYDGREYWLKSTEDFWQAWSATDFKLHLRVNHKLRSVAPGKREQANDPCSELDKVLAHIHQQNRIEAALPFVHMPSGIIKVSNLTYLNTSTAQCLNPSVDNITEWGDHFPWLAGFLKHLFPEPQLDYFLSWLHYFYTSAYAHKPQPGQALFIVGDTGVGKTLLSSHILSRIMGGHADASSFLLGDERFTASILSQPIMAVDDTVPATDTMRHNRYSAMIKKITANRWLQYEQKFQKAGKVLWNGRVIVTCNADPESIRLLPNMDISIKDKVSLFRCRDSAVDFPSGPDLEALLDEELPYFCRWLMNYIVPRQCLGNSRFYIASFHHSQLYKQALQTSSCYSFFELLQAFLRAYGEAMGATEWEGNATELLAAMCADEGLRGVATRYSTNQIASMLGQLKARGYDMERSRKRGGRVWVIPIDLDSPVDESEVADA